MPRDTLSDEVTWQKLAIAHQGLLQAIGHEGIPQDDTTAALETAEQIRADFLMKLTDDLVRHTDELALLHIRTKVKRTACYLESTADLYLGPIALPPFECVKERFPFVRYAHSSGLIAAEIKVTDGPLSRSALVELIQRLWLPWDEGRCSIELCIGNEEVDAWFKRYIGRWPFLRRALITSLERDPNEQPFRPYVEQLDMPYPLALVS